MQHRTPRGIRTVVAVVTTLLAFSSSTTAARRDGGDPEPQVAVNESSGVYSVRAQFEVPQPAATALTVLTDYEQIPRFMPEVKSSRIVERSNDRLVIEQEAVARVMLFSKRVFLRLDVRIADDEIHFRDASGRSFNTYEGTWRVGEQHGRTTVRYELRARPAFDVPSFLLTRLFKRDALQMIERLQIEIAARDRARAR